MQLDDRAGDAARELNSMFEYSPIPDPPTSRVGAPRRLVLVGAIAAVTAVVGGGVYFASNDPIAPAGEVQSTPLHYGVTELPDGWRRTVIPTGRAVDITPMPEFVVVRNGGALIGMWVATPDMDGPAIPDRAETVRAGSVDVYVAATGQLTADDEPVWTLIWQQDGLTATANSTDRAAALATIAGLVKDGTALVPSSNEFGTVAYRGASKLLTAVYSPVLSSRSLDLDEVTAYSPESGQYGLSLVVQHGGASEGLPSFFEFLIETGGLRATQGWERDGVLVPGAVLDTGAPQGRMEIAFWQQGDDVIVLSGLALPEGEFASFVARVSTVDDATWQQWIDASDVPPVGVTSEGDDDIQSGVAVPVLEPAAPDSAIDAPAQDNAAVESVPEASIGVGDEPERAAPIANPPTETPVPSEPDTP